MNEKEKKAIEFEKQMDLDYVDKNYISKDKIRKFVLSESQADAYHFKTVSLDRLLKFLEEE